MIFPNGKPKTGTDVLWRIEFGESDPRLEASWYEVKKRTKKGAWIGSIGPHGRFVLLSANEKFACETITDAIKSFEARKKKQIKTLEAQLQRAKADLSLLEREDKKAGPEKGGLKLLRHLGTPVYPGEERSAGSLHSTCGVAGSLTML
jgi:hypothetical protein